VLVIWVIVAGCVIIRGRNSVGISTKGIDVRKAYDQGWVEEMQDAGRLPMSADQITHEMKLGLLRFESDSKFCVACRYCIYAYRGRFNPPKI